MSRREILAAVVEAKRIHNQYDCESRARSGEGRVDVFGILVEMGIPVMFRPLTALLGAYFGGVDQGVMVTTQRPLPVQRFTAAHELGHAALKHETSLDDEEVLTRSSFDGRARYDIREIQANAFATEFLTPMWLIADHVSRQRWEPRFLADPATVYQLALRMGSSYQATCYALQECRAIGRSTCKEMLGVKPKEIKQELAKPYKPANWYGDVWLITERDNGMVLEGSRSDLVVIQIPEHPNSGYIWNFGDLLKAGLTIRKDGHVSTDGEHIGGIVFRKAIAESKGAIKASVTLRETRPWTPDATTLNAIQLDVDFMGPIQAGLHPAQRLQALESAA